MPENAFAASNENGEHASATPEAKPFEKQETRVPAEPEPAKTEDPDYFTHYVHLADGRVLRANLTEIPHDSLGSRYYEKNGDGEDAEETSVPIIGVYSR